MAHPSITQAEGKYRKLLSGECRRIFTGTSIPSHDHLHHERVWENAVLLIERMYNKGLISDPGLAGKAIVAAFFHDTGLTVNRGPDHGLESRRICSIFLTGADFSEADRKEILDAVEMHDNK
jgi:HD superfamily phosphodiesterase